MKWTFKWGTLWALAHMPGGRFLHERMLRQHGELSRLERSSRFTNAIEIVRDIRRHCGRLEGARIVELGTGWVPAAPLAMALAGARVHTFDVRRLADGRLFRRTLAELGRMLEPLAIAAGNRGRSVQRRFRDMLCAADLDEALYYFGGSYVAPANTCHLPIDDNSVDVVVSSLVLQCIPGNVLPDVLRESYRILSPSGIALHRIRMTDEYAQADPRRGSLEFLKYSTRTWDRWFNHRLKHQNRLRASQFEQLLREAGFDTIARSTDSEPEQIVLLKRCGIDTSFSHLDWEDIVTVAMTLVAGKRLVS